MSKYIDASLVVEMQLYDDEHEEWGVWNGTIEDLLNQWTEEGCPPAIEVSEDCISRQEVLDLLICQLFGGEVGDILKQIDNLPPVTSTVNEDCVSREYLKSFGYINKGDFNSVETIREWIDNAPSVTPTERTGEWERFSFPDGDVMECTNCGYRDWADVWEEESRNYCPNCGAKMNKGGDDNG